MGKEDLILELIRSVKTNLSRVEKKLDIHLSNKTIHKYPTTVKQVGIFLGKTILLISLIVGISYNMININKAYTNTKIRKEVIK